MRARIEINPITSALTVTANSDGEEDAIPTLLEGIPLQIKHVNVTVNRGGFILRTMDRSKADLIVAVDGKPVHTFDDLLTHVESKKPGDKVVLSIIREGEKLDLPVTLQQARE